MTRHARAIYVDCSCGFVHKSWYFVHCHCLGHIFHQNISAAMSSAMTAASCWQPHTRWEAAVSSCCGYMEIILQSNQMYLNWPKISISLWTTKHTRWCCGESYTSFLWDFCSKSRMFGNLRSLSASLRTSLRDCMNSPRKLWLGHCISRSPLDSTIILQHSPNKIWRLLPCFHWQKS